MAFSRGPAATSRRLLLISILLPLAGIVALANLSETIALYLYVTGRAGQCSLEQAINGRHLIVSQRDAAKALAERSRPVGPATDGLRQWETPWGMFWAPEGGESGLFWVLAEQMRGTYSSDAVRVRQGDVVLDCGANLGTFTRAALRSGARLVVAIEPVPWNVESMRRTFRDEIAAGRVIVVPEGVWHKDDTLPMELHHNSALDSFVMRNRVEERGAARGVLTLPLTTVDRIVAEHKLPRVDFIKMDVEGAERHALAGAAGILWADRPRLAIATENLADDQMAVPQAIRHLVGGYQASCAACMPSDTGVLRPDITFFRP